MNERMAFIALNIWNTSVTKSRQPILTSHRPDCWPNTSRHCWSGEISCPGRVTWSLIDILESKRQFTLLELQYTYRGRQITVATISRLLSAYSWALPFDLFLDSLVVVQLVQFVAATEHWVKRYKANSEYFSIFLYDDFMDSRHLNKNSFNKLLNNCAVMTCLLAYC